MNADALNEYEGLKNHCLFLTRESSLVSDDTLTIYVLNMQSLEQRVNNIVGDYRCLKNDVIGFTETQIKPSDYISKIGDTFKDFHMNFKLSLWKPR